MLCSTGQMYGNTGGAPPAGPFSFVDKYTDAAVGATSKSFAACSIGDAAADRLTVVPISVTCTNTGNQSLSAVTIGGVAATLVVSETHSTRGLITAIYQAALPGGTTADVAFTCSATIAEAVIGIYRFSGHASNTPHDTANAEGNFSADLSVTCDLPANGYLIAAASEYPEVAVTMTFTAGVTADYAEIGAGDDHLGGHYASTTAETNRTITADPSTTVRFNLVAASWG
ncbi:hypothetical protein [Mesorhizobium sp.]|uniref:hypothetical protein n=1 Tax=Mesorhizobium sp. TaxID=1871066 RepID=UPI000FE99E4E|nr:hypothetical protein [Mesorhizobium sp.]RWN28887.1 MAG: hypothetical protein EOR95_22920 [Mesorhizobium sp.]